MMDQYTIIGKFIATFGIKGDLVLKHHMGEGLNVDALKTLFIEEKSGKFMPYFIASVKNKNDEEALIQLEGVDAPEKAKIFLRKQVWLPEQEVKIQASKHAPIVGSHRTANANIAQDRLQGEGGSYSIE
jgi:16S rRNA processing protein RimM